MRIHPPLAALLRDTAHTLTVALPIALTISIAGIQPAYSQVDPSNKMAAMTVITMLLLDSCKDEDMDKLCDDDEIKYFGDIDTVNDADADFDGDQLSNGLEMNTYHSDPTNINTDGDALGDFAESLIGTSLIVAFDDGGTLGGDTAADKLKLHKLNRLTFGPTQAELDQVTAAGGIDAWISDQLIPIGLPPAPSRIGVAPLYTVDNDIYPRPYDCNNHITPDPAQAMRDCFVSSDDGDADIPGTFRPMHSSRQLQTRMAMFWDNHFNTNLSSHDRGMQELYDEDNWFVNAFGSFRSLLELNAKNYTMLEYLDLDDNVRTRPNENFPREIMELHSVGIDGGYEDDDIAQLAYILTGWDHDDIYDIDDLGVCSDEPLLTVIDCLPYVSRYAYQSHANNDVGDGGTGETGLEDSAKFDALRIFEFRAGDHDEGLADYDGDGVTNVNKTLSWSYQDTTYSTTVASRQGAAGEDEGQEALDFLATHPATADFICKKLAQEFISDSPQATTLSSCASTFLANSNASDQMGKVLANLLDSSEFNSAANQRIKLKDTQEVMFSLGRVLGWNMADVNISHSNSLAGQMQDAEQRIFYKAEPTGYYETADNWLDTNIALHRFREMNDMLDDDQTQSFVDYFKSLGKTSSGKIMEHLFIVMLGGHYDTHDVQMGLYWLHNVDLEDSGSTQLQAFNIDNGDAEDRIRGLIARLAALPAFQLH